MDGKQKEEVALYRYGLIRPILDEGIPRAEFSARLDAVVNQTHQHPKGDWRRVSRRTLIRWAHSYRVSGFKGLFPKERADIGAVRATETEILDLAEKLKREAPRRSSATICRIVAQTNGVSVSERTIRRHLAKRGATFANLVGQQRRVFVRFERERPNELWTGDMLHGPFLMDPNGSGNLRKTYLFAFIDDHSRLVPHGEFFFDESLPRLERAFRIAIEKRGCPSAIYVDNGAVFTSHQLDRICAHLGIKRILSTPGEPAGRGKIERFFRTVRSQFLVEIACEGVSSLSQLNASFIAWLEIVYHHREHSETKETPLKRFAADFTPKVVDPKTIHNAFLWEEKRRVGKTATVSVAGNRYEVDAHLVHREVNLRFDPFDLSRIEVFYQGESFGGAKPYILKRGAHPGAKKNIEIAPAPKSGIDYLALLRKEHETALNREIPYRDLADENEKE